MLVPVGVTVRVGECLGASRRPALHVVQILGLERRIQTLAAIVARQGTDAA